MSGDKPPIAAAAHDAASRLARLSIGILRNPGSGSNLRNGRAMRDELAAHPDAPSRDVAGPAHVTAALTEMAARGIDTIAISGGDGTVNVQDLLAVIGAWGACANPNDCPADIAPAGGNDVVNVEDLLAVIGAWGACP